MKQFQTYYTAPYNGLALPVPGPPNILAVLRKKMIPLGCYRRERRSWSCLCFILRPISWEAVKTHLRCGLRGEVRVCGTRGAPNPAGMLGGDILGGRAAERRVLPNYAPWCWCSSELWQLQAPYRDIQVHLFNGVWGVAYDYFGKKTLCIHPSIAGWWEGSRGSCSAPARLFLFGTAAPHAAMAQMLPPPSDLCLAIPATSPPPRAVFQTIYPLTPCCISFVRKKRFSPRNGANNDGVEDNFNDTVLAPVHGFREIHPSQNSDHFRTRDKSFSWLPADGRLRKAQYWVSWPSLSLLAHRYIWYCPLCGQQRWRGSVSQSTRFAFCAKLFGTFLIYVNRSLAANCKVPYRCLKSQHHHRVALWVNRRVGSKYGKDYGGRLNFSHLPLALERGIIYIFNSLFSPSVASWNRHFLRLQALSALLHCCIRFAAGDQRVHWWCALSRTLQLRSIIVTRTQSLTWSDGSQRTQFW